MGQLGQNLRFAQKSPGVGAGFEHLDRANRAAPLVLGSVHDAHASSTELVFEQETLSEGFS
jgi:hypothetical protein